MGKRIKATCTKCGLDRPTPENLPALLDAWQAYTSTHGAERKRDYLIMYAFLGLTYSELYRIGPTDIDWDGNQVYIRGTKTDYRRRTVPMDLKVRTILWERKDRTPMFPTWSASNMCRDIKKACAYASTDGTLKPATANDLRRTFATWLAREGVPLLNLAKLMGHSGTQMLTHVYARVERGKHMHEAIGKLPEHPRRLR